MRSLPNTKAATTLAHTLGEAEAAHAREPKHGIPSTTMRTPEITAPTPQDTLVEIQTPETGAHTALTTRMTAAHIAHTAHTPPAAARAIPQEETQEATHAATHKRTPTAKTTLGRPTMRETPAGTQAPGKCLTTAPVTTPDKTHQKDKEPNNRHKPQKR